MSSWLPGSSANQWAWWMWATWWLGSFQSGLIRSSGSTWRIIPLWTGMSTSTRFASQPAGMTYGPYQKRIFLTVPGGSAT